MKIEPSFKIYFSFFQRRIQLPFFAVILPIFTDFQAPNADGRGRDGSDCHQDWIRPALNAARLLRAAQDSLRERRLAGQASRQENPGVRVFLGCTWHHHSTADRRDVRDSHGDTDKVSVSRLAEQCCCGAAKQLLVCCMLRRDGSK